MLNRNENLPKLAPFRLDSKALLIACKTRWKSMGLPEDEAMVFDMRLVWYRMFLLKIMLSG